MDKERKRKASRDAYAETKKISIRGVENCMLLKRMILTNDVENNTQNVDIHPMSPILEKISSTVNNQSSLQLEPDADINSAIVQPDSGNDMRILNKNKPLI